MNTSRRHFVLFCVGVGSSCVHGAIATCHAFGRGITATAYTAPFDSTSKRAARP